jgi:hypothetical protein
VVQSVALVTYARTEPQTRVPALRSGLRHVLRDAARHASSGLACLREQSARLAAPEREERAGFVLDSVRALAEDLGRPLDLCGELGWPPTELRRHLRRPDSPDEAFRRALYRRVIVGLRRVGLATRTARERVRALGYSALWDDLQAD